MKAEQDYLQEIELQLPSAPDTRMIIGKCGIHPHPYQRTVSITEERRMEKKARSMAPPRHCLNCERALVKRAVVKADTRTSEVYFSKITYGFNGCGYWCTRRCMKESAPKMVEGLLKIAGVKNYFHQEFGDPLGIDSPIDIGNPLSVIVHLHDLALQTLNSKRKKFPISAR